MNLKTAQDISKMRDSGKVLAEILRELSAMPRVGMTTATISKKAAQLIRDHGVEPSFLNYNGYPDVICLSVNHQAVHTPGSDYALKDGDLLKLDFGVVRDGWQSDSAVTVLVAERPEAPEHAQKRKLIQATRDALLAGIAAAKVGNHLGDIGAAIQGVIESAGFTVVKELGGHGIGRALHEEPWVANFGRKGQGEVLVEGMVLALEPITSLGKKGSIADGADGHTYEMKDGSLSAHFEHTVAITARGPQVLTA
jgi:methionyl aminopeptidase